jgi:hypothetical protein
VAAPTLDDSDMCRRAAIAAELNPSVELRAVEVAGEPEMTTSR